MQGSGSDLEKRLVSEASIHTLSNIITVLYLLTSMMIIGENMIWCY